MRVLVTGGSGFVGRATVQELVKDNFDVVIFDKKEPSFSGVTNVTFKRGNLTDVNSLREALEGVEAVIHLAAKVGIEQSPADVPDYVKNNVLGTSILLSTMKEMGCANFVLASSMVVYGEGKYICEVHGQVQPQTRRKENLNSKVFDPECFCGKVLQPGMVEEDADLLPASGYAYSKKMQEELTALWVKQTAGKVAALRYHNIYGPYMPKNTPYSGVAAMWRSALERGERVKVFEDGLQRRDFVHVQDVAKANVLALNHLLIQNESYWRAYNVASGEVVAIKEMAEQLSLAFHSEPPVITGQWRLEDVRHVTASISRITQELGYETSVTFKEGVTKFATDPLA